MGFDDRLLQSLQQAQDAYEQRDFERAETLLRQVIREHRGFADTFNMLGVICHTQGRLPQAQEAFEEALRINPQYTEAALSLAVTYNELGQYDKAREIYSRAMEKSRAEPQRLDPFARGKLANMHARTADAYVGVGLNEEAAREYRKALELCPTFVDIRAKLASTLRDIGDKEGAIAEYRKAKLQQPQYLPARVHLGVTLYSTGNKDEARREWESVLLEDPNNASCKMYLDIVKN